MVRKPLSVDDPLRRQESVDLMQKAAKLDPRSAIIAHNLGEGYRNRGLYTLAENQYKKVIEIHPDFELTYTFLPLLYMFDMGQFDKALALLNKAIALYPESHSHKVLKVITYMNLGDVEAAQENRDELAGSGAEEWRLGFMDVRIIFWQRKSDRHPGIHQQAVAKNAAYDEYRPAPDPGFNGT